MIINVSIPERLTKYPPVIEKVGFCFPHKPGVAKYARAGERKVVEGIRKN